ncbi:hypothetical protein [Streptomyces sp. NPDC056464]|uniref:hypothetical protein n=1 Tax=Streptomyces sp. NPDC056464 TaxID=3345828 RepID=UPI0036A23F6F
MADTKHRAAIVMAAIAAGCGTVASAVPAGAATPAKPVIHRCKDAQHATPGTHLFIQSAANHGFCVTGKGTLRDFSAITAEPAGRAFNLKPANGKLMKVRLVYYVGGPSGTREVRVLDRKNESTDINYATFKEITITSL